MVAHIKILFFPHEENNYKSKVLHLSSLSFFIILIIAFQSFITLFHQVKPGVLGFAANINPETVVSLTNGLRNNDGLSSLAIDSKLNEAARQKATDMFAKGYWAHYSPGGISPWSFFKNAGYTYLYAGENLARDFGDSDSVVQAWMASPTHRDNILNPNYKNIGVAVVDGMLNGEETTLVVQLFGTPTEAVAAVPPESATKGISKEASLLAVTQEEAVLVPETYIGEAQALIPTPVISSFLVTKTINLSLLAVFLVVLLIDGIYIWKKKIIRLSGRNFIHFSFLAIILTVILLTRNGQIL